MVREWYESGTNVSGAELGRRAAILSLLTLLHLRRVSLLAACVHFLFFCFFSIPYSTPSSFFSMLFASSSSSSASSSFLLYLIHILGPPSPDSCRAAPFVRQCNFLETTDSQHRKSAESLPRRTKRSVAMHVLVSSGNTFHAFSW